MDNLRDSPRSRETQKVARYRSASSDSDSDVSLQQKKPKHEFVSYPHRTSNDRPRYAPSTLSSIETTDDSPVHEMIRAVGLEHARKTKKIKPENQKTQTRNSDDAGYPSKPSAALRRAPRDSVSDLDNSYETNDSFQFRGMSLKDAVEAVGQEEGAPVAVTVKYSFRKPVASLQPNTPMLYGMGKVEFGAVHFRKKRQLFVPPGSLHLNVQVEATFCPDETTSSFSSGNEEAVAVPWHAKITFAEPKLSFLSIISVSLNFICPDGNGTSVSVFENEENLKNEKKKSENFQNEEKNSENFKNEKIVELSGATNLNGCFKLCIFRTVSVYVDYKINWEDFLDLIGESEAPSSGRKSFPLTKNISESKNFRIHLINTNNNNNNNNDNNNNDDNNNNNDNNDNDYNNTNNSNNNNEEIFFTVREHTQVEAIRKALQERWSVRADQFILTFGGRFLTEGERTVGSYGIVDGDVIECQTPQVGC